MAEDDPSVTSWFAVEFQGHVKGAFRECTGLGGENHTVTLKRGIVPDVDLWNWRALVERGEDARRHATITMVDHMGKPVAKWDVERAWPSKLKGPSVSATNSEVGIEELEITHDGCRRTAP